MTRVEKGAWRKVYKLMKIQRVHSWDTLFGMSFVIAHESKEFAANPSCTVSIVSVGEDIG